MALNETVVIPGSTPSAEARCIAQRAIKESLAEKGRRVDHDGFASTERFPRNISQPVD
jgi:hypothetical protein